MTGLLLDMETGDLYLDENGKTVQVDDNRAFKQIIAGVLSCEKGAEILNPYYGFPLIDAIQNSGVGNSEMFIESLVADALDSRYCRLIGSVNYIKATQDDIDGRKMNVEISVTSITGENISFEETIQT